VLSQGNRAFGRQSFVGLQGGFGSLTLGRQYTMRYYGILDADLFGSGAHGLGVLDSGIPNARADNAINYRGTFGPVSVGATYSLGRDTVSANNPTATNCAGETTPSKQCRTVAAMLKYAGGNWGVVGSYERQHGGTAATFGGLTNPELTDNRLMLNAYLHAAGGRYAVGWIKRNNEGAPATPKSNLVWVVGSQPVAEKVVLDAMLSGVKFENSPNKAAQVDVRGNYVFSKRTSVYLSVAYLKNGGSLALLATSNAPATAPTAGGSQNGIMAGIRHSF
jgi:predicted porin